MGPATRAVQTGIGLVAELQEARKERKASQNGANDASSSVKDLTMYDKREDSDGNDDDGSEDDEHFGGSGVVEDDGADESVPPYDEPPPAYPAEDIADIRDVKYPQPDSSGERSKLSCPIVIPQRRPGSKGRGFLRAYAPILADRDIDQQMFLKFLKDFHKASQASPILNVITIGAGAMGHIAEPITIAIAITISVASGTAAELQSRYRTNTFLDKANASLFNPRGLHCLIMSLRPNDTPKGNIGMEAVDSSTAALKWQLNPEKAASFPANLRQSSGVTHGEGEMPETAPLIYPDTGYAELGRRPQEAVATAAAATGGAAAAAATTSNASPQKPGEFATYRKVVGNYFDKRAQAKYAYDHPASTLTTSNSHAQELDDHQQKPHFASKYGDPTHPSVTMNYWGRAVSKLEKESLAERQARRHGKALEARRRGGVGVVRRVFEGSVLYLMIVDLPSEADVEAAKREVLRKPADEGVAEV